VRAFFSDPFYADHQDITQSAIAAPNQFCIASDKCFQFSATAIMQINLRHLAQDTGAYDADDHFDSNHFAGALQKMAINRGQLNSLLAGATLQGGNYAQTQLQAWALLGNMLHAAEDFYAHSTWVDEGNINIIGFGAATENTSAPNYGIFPNPLATTFCSSAQGYPFSNVPVFYLISGYYDVPTPNGGCIHGSLTAILTACAAAKNPLNFFAVQIPGISHDIPCAGDFTPSDAMAYHLLAYQAAIDEANDLVNSIVNDLVASQNAAGFCTLLDVPITNPVCLTASTTAFTVINPQALPGGGDSVTLTVSVQGFAQSAANQTAPTGTVTFTDTSGNTLTCEGVQSNAVQLVVPETGTASTATCQTALSQAPDPVTASYGGDSNFSPSTAVTTILAQTTTTLGPVPALVADGGGPITLTATIQAPGTSPPPGSPSGPPQITGLVDFLDQNSVVLCTAVQLTLDGQGNLTAQCPATITAVPDTVTAYYSGDANYAASSGNLTVGSQVTLTANPAFVLPGGSTTLTWDAATGGSCVESGGSAGDGWNQTIAATANQSGSQVVTESSPGTYTYVLNCTPSGATTSNSAQVSVVFLSPTYSGTGRSALKVTIAVPTALNPPASCVFSAVGAATGAISGGGGLGPLTDTTLSFAKTGSQASVTITPVSMTPLNVVLGQSGADVCGPTAALITYPYSLTYSLTLTGPKVTGTTTYGALTGTLANGVITGTFWFNNSAAGASGSVEASGPFSVTAQ
jgi:hypothetical protein